MPASGYEIRFFITLFLYVIIMCRKISDILTVGLICGILSSSTSYCRKVSKVN
jgi:hypothetical protein